MGIQSRTNLEAVKLRAEKYPFNRNNVSGPAHHNWGGGRFQSRTREEVDGEIVVTDSYAGIKMPSHRLAGKNGYVLEHRYIWEQVHQKKLPKSWVVHHLNGIRNDNRPENLFATPRSKHINYAEPYKQRVRELEAKVKLLERTLEANQLIFYIGEN